MTEPSDNIPWYRQLWPWLVMLPPAAAVIAGIATVVIANTNPDSLAAGDFRKVGLVATKVTERDHIAAQLGMHADVSIDHDTGQVTVRLEGKASPDALQLSLHHPTRAALDRSSTLQRDATELYRGNVGTLESHRWYLQLVDSQSNWRLTDELAADQRLLKLAPNAAIEQQ
jgi:hypothetical protein